MEPCKCINTEKDIGLTKDLDLAKDVGLTKDVTILSSEGTPLDNKTASPDIRSFNDSIVCLMTGP